MYLKIKINTFEATLQLKPGVIPKFCKARSVPFALKAAIERELDRMESEGILEKVSYSEWAAPVVPVPKIEGTIRLCLSSQDRRHHKAMW